MFQTFRIVRYITSVHRAIEGSLTLSIDRGSTVHCLALLLGGCVIYICAQCLHRVYILYIQPWEKDKKECD